MIRYRIPSYDDGMPIFPDKNGKFVKFSDHLEVLRSTSTNKAMFQLLCEKFIKVYESSGISKKLADFADEVALALAQQKH